MKAFTAVIERCPDTGLYAGFVPGFAGAHSQGETLDELRGQCGVMQPVVTFDEYSYRACERLRLQRFLVQP